MNPTFDIGAPEPVLRLILRPSVVRRALVMALIVGHVLAAINHGDRIAAGAMTPSEWGKVILTFSVPYVVSTISSVLAIFEQRRAFGTPSGDEDEFKKDI